MSKRSGDEHTITVTAGGGDPITMTEREFSKAARNAEKQDRFQNVSRIGSNSDLRSFVDRITRLLNEQDTLRDDLKELMEEAKGKGFDKKALKFVAKLLREDGDDNEYRAMVNRYLESLDELPLFSRAA